MQHIPVIYCERDSLFFKLNFCVGINNVFHNLKLVLRLYGRDKYGIKVDPTYFRPTGNKEEKINTREDMRFPKNMS